MSETHAARRTIGLISLSSALIITGALVASQVGTTSPLPTAVSVIGWMSASMAAWAWLARLLLQVARAVARLTRDLTALSEHAREHREQLTAELKQAVADSRDEVKLHAIMWLLEHQRQVQATERDAHAIQHALDALDQRPDCPADELAERRAAR